MLFSSNQRFEVSGNLRSSDELSSALEFALKFSGNYENMTKREIDRGAKLLYQITEDDKYCIGWAFGEVPSGWSEYPFRFDIEIVSRIIKQYLEDFPVEEHIGDGSYRKGFIMKCLSYSDYDTIKESFHCIVYFEPYTCYYAK